MARRRLTVRRIDPWSVLKFGIVANIALLIIGLLVVGVIFFIIDRLGLVDQVCTIVLEVGFQACGVNAGNLFRAIALLGLLGVIIQTAVLVFLSFLHNLIADLTGGLALTVLDDSPTAGVRTTTASSATTVGTPMTAGRRPAGDDHRTGASGPASVPPLGRDRPADERDDGGPATAEHTPVTAPGRRRDTPERHDEDDLFGRS